VDVTQLTTGSMNATRASNSKTFNGQ